MIGASEGVRFPQDEPLRHELSRDNIAAQFSKVPEVALGFWIIKILATTLGETGGDAVTMSMNLGYAVGTLIFLAIFLAAVAVQIRAKSFNAYLYWLTIVATTTVGTTIADFVDRSLGIGYFGGSTLLLACLMASLAIWRWSEGTVSVNTIATPKAESFYWVRSCFPRRSAPRSAIGSPTPTISAMEAAQSCSPARSSAFSRFMPPHRLRV